MVIDGAEGRKKSSRIVCPALDAALADWVCKQYARHLVVPNDAIEL